MDKKNNMKQAMYEMFGVGSETAAPAAKKEEAFEVEAPVVERAAAPEKSSFVRTAPMPTATASYIAPGTVMEGTLRATGDVEIAGEFKGDITTDGTVILHSNIEGNLTVSSLNLSGCSLKGDVVANGLVFISVDSKVTGNITAKELQCSGKITGDVKVAENTVLEGTAQVNGNITTGTLAVARGAIIKGGIEMNGVGK